MAGWNVSPHSTRRVAKRAAGRQRMRAIASRSSVWTEMKYNKLGSSDLNVSEVCLGTMTFGEQNTEAEAHAQLSYARERGVNFLDTAEIYPVVPNRDTQGRTSEFVGRWLHCQKRDSVVVATKVSGRSTGLAWVPANRTDPRGVEQNPKLDGASIEAAVNAELRRLKTDYVDLIQLHWPDRYFTGFGRSQYHASQEWESVSFDEQVAAVGKLIEQGKVRNWGLSNESTYGVMMHCMTADKLGVPRPVSIQNSFSLLHRSFESELAEACSPSHMNLGLLPWSALAGGGLSGKYLNSQFPGGSRFTLFPKRYDRFNSARAQAAIAKYVQIARDYGCTPSQLAYAFCKSRWYIPSTIVGATSVDQLEENVNAFAFELPQDVLEAIDAVHCEHRNPSLVD